MPDMLAHPRSTNIDSIGYDPATSELHVKFRSGGTYVYSNVPRHVHNELMNASSAGSFIAKNIKDHYTHRKL